MRLKYFIAYTKNVNNLEDFTLACISLNMYECNFYKYFGNLVSNTTLVRNVNDTKLLENCDMYLKMLNNIGINSSKVKSLKELLRDLLIFKEVDYPSRLSIITSFSDNPISFKYRLDTYTE